MRARLLVEGLALAPQLLQAPEDARPPADDAFLHGCDAAPREL